MGSSPPPQEQRSEWGEAETDGRGNTLWTRTRGHSSVSPRPGQGGPQRQDASSRGQVASDKGAPGTALPEAETPWEKSTVPRKFSGPGLPENWQEVAPPLSGWSSEHTACGYELCGCFPA